MDVIKSFNSNHYSHFLDEANDLIANHKDIDTWIRCLSKEEINIYIRTIKHLKSNNLKYIEECSILLTIIIRFFFLELDYDDEISITTKQIKNLVNKFEKAIETEEKAIREKKPFNGKYSLIT
jgi:hypothetical protein